MAPHFKLPNPDKQPRINLVPKTGVLVYSRSDRVENQEYTPHMLCLRRSSYPLILFWICSTNLFIIFCFFACVCVCVCVCVCACCGFCVLQASKSLVWSGCPSYGIIKGLLHVDAARALSHLMSVVLKLPISRPFNTCSYALVTPNHKIVSVACD